MTPEIQALEDLLDRLIASVEAVIASGQVIPKEIQKKLTEEIIALNQDIEELYDEAEQQNIAPTEQITPPETQPIPPIEQEDIPPPSPNQPIQVTDNVRLVWILSGGRRDVFTDYLSNFPDPAFRDILANPTELQRIIAELEQNNPVSNYGDVQDGIAKSQINSSNVYGVQYDFKKKNLLVRFNNGSVYAYDAPPQLYNLVAGGRAAATTDDKRKPLRFWRGKNPSLGASVWQYLRNTGVPYRRLK